jgi:hypothetical protein
MHSHLCLQGSFNNITEELFVGGVMIDGTTFMLCLKFDGQNAKIILRRRRVRATWTFANSFPDDLALGIT